MAGLVVYRAGCQDFSSLTPQLLAIGVLCAAASLGCSKRDLELGTVEGTVTLNQQPLAEATVMFKPQRGRPSLAETDAQGHYKLGYRLDEPGARLGPHTVSISTLKQADGYLVKKTVPERVPTQYNRRTKLTAEVKPGANTFDFDLKSP